MASCIRELRHEPPRATLCTGVERGERQRMIFKMDRPTFGVCSRSQWIIVFSGATIAGMYDRMRLSRSGFGNPVPAALAFALMVAQAALPWTAKHFVTQDGPSHLYNAVVVKDLALDSHSSYAAVYAIQRKFVSNWGTVVVFNGLVFLF